MNIQVLGSGCSNCKKLHELTQEAVKQLNLDENVEYITDVSKIIEMGVMTTPVLAVNGKPIMAGFVPDIKKIKSLLTKGIDETDVKNSDTVSSCSCGGKC
jgi:small redox-active disulfide protein 2